MIKHRAGALSIELRELMASKTILLGSYVTRVLHTAGIASVDSVLYALSGSERDDRTADRVPVILTYHPFKFQIKPEVGLLIKPYLLQNFLYLSTDQQMLDIFPRPSFVSYKRDLRIMLRLELSTDNSTEQPGSFACQRSHCNTQRLVEFDYVRLPNPIQISRNFGVRLERLGYFVFRLLRFAVIFRRFVFWDLGYFRCSAVPPFHQKERGPGNEVAV